MRSEVKPSYEATRSLARGSKGVLPLCPGIRQREAERSGQDSYDAIGRGVIRQRSVKTVISGLASIRALPTRPRPRLT